MVGLAALWRRLPVVRMNGRAVPVTALAHMPPALAAEPLRNTYNFGSYLIFSHIRPFIGGRANMYGDGSCTSTCRPICLGRRRWKQRFAQTGYAGPSSQQAIP